MKPRRQDDHSHYFALCYRRRRCRGLRRALELSGLTQLTTSTCQVGDPCVLPFQPPAISSGPGCWEAGHHHRRVRFPGRGCVAAWSGRDPGRSSWVSLCFCPANVVKPVDVEGESSSCREKRPVGIARIVRLSASLPEVGQRWEIRRRVELGKCRLGGGVWRQGLGCFSSPSL